MELEIKHLVAYLPYELKLKEIDNLWHKDEFIILTLNIIIDILDYPKDFKPILRNLSEFNDIDSVNEFLGLGEWCDAYDDYFDAWFNDSQNIQKLVLQAPYEIFQYFLENHYDVFDLIKNDLAIDINTL
jgi:hypothetical protein